MILQWRKHRFRLTIAAWAMAADLLGKELKDLGDTDNAELFWAIVISSRRYYAMSKGNFISRFRLYLMKKALIREHVRKNLGASKSKRMSGIELLQRGISDSTHSALKETLKKKVN